MLFWSFFSMVWVIFHVDNIYAAGKVSCFYNSTAHWRIGLAKFTYEHLKPALPYCTHLVYGFIGVHKYTYEVNSINRRLDSESGLKNFQNTVKLKSLNPSIKMFLSVMGYRDTKPEVYFKVLETNDSRAKFIKSLVSMVEENGFDGADLAWKFPTYEEEKNESVHDTSLDVVKRHRTKFKYLVEELSAELKRRKRLLTLTVLPYVKADEFVIFDTIKDCVEHIHLMTYDYKTPWRFPYEADYAAPLYYVENRNENRNIEQTVNWWIERELPAEKLLIAVPTFGRSWRIDNSSGWNMKPPVKANGAGEPGVTLNEAGILPYYELCETETISGAADNLVMLEEVKEHHFGSYAYHRESIWVSFDDPETVAEKAKYAGRMRLGGVAIVDLSLDDFVALCYASRGVPFPILRAAKDNLDS